jgi:hypothetical protein
MTASAAAPVVSGTSDSDFPYPLVPRKGVGPKVVEPTRKAATRTRCHDVPSTLQPWEPKEIVSSLRAGRSVEQTRKEYNTTSAVALELWLRDMERRLAGLARPVAAMAFLLIGVSIADVWEAALGGQAVVERAFRKTGRARKRGLEDGNGLIELRQMCAVGGAA